MKHISGRTAAWLVIALIIASVHGEAAAGKAPTAEKILDRFVEVTGGRKAYDALENRKSSSSMSIPAQGMTFTITMWTARPNQVYSEIELSLIHI